MMIGGQTDLVRRIKQSITKQNTPENLSLGFRFLLGPTESKQLIVVIISADVGARRIAVSPAVGQSEADWEMEPDERDERFESGGPDREGRGDGVD